MMTKLSKILVGKEKWERYYDDLWEAISSLNDVQKAKDFFFDILTHTERKMLAKRLQTAIMLVSGRSYSEIRSEIHITDATIAKMNNRLKTGAKSLVAIARALRREEEIKQPRGRYLAGDLLSPLVEEGIKFIDRKAKAAKRVRRLKKLRGNS